MNYTTSTNDRHRYAPLSTAEYLGNKGNPVADMVSGKNPGRTGGGSLALAAG